MVVDDESLVRVGLQSLFDWESNGYRIVGAFRNGQEAIEAIRISCPDVLLTDIKMPVMDGFELIETARHEYPDLNIIILTSVEEYDCMRNAMRYGVSDYILKYRIEQNELIRVLDSLMYHDAPGESRVEDLISQAKHALVELSSKHTGKMCEIKARASIEALMKTMREYGDSCVWMVIMPEMEAGRNDDVQFKVSCILIRETFEKYRNVIYLGEEDTSIHAMLFLKKTLLDCEINTALSDILMPLVDTLRDKTNIHVKIGVSKRSELTDPLHAGLMRNSADKALLQSFYQEAVFFWDNSIYEMTGFSDKDWHDFRHELKQHIEKRDMDALSFWMQALEKRVFKRIMPADVIHLYRYVIQQMIDCAIDMMKESNKVSQIGFQKLLECADQMEEAHSLHELSGIAQGIVMELARSVTHNSSGKWVQTVTHFISTNCSEVIRLRDAAQMVNFSESYFSMRFHQEAGMSFSEYVSGERMKKAIEMIRKSDMSTEEIAGRVGYSNTNYFVKAFKKHTGRTISDFRKNR